MLSNWHSSVVQKLQALYVCSPHLDLCTRCTPLVRVQARHVALKAPCPNKSGKECHYSYIQGECESPPAFLCVHTRKPFAQGPSHLCTFETGPPRHNCWSIHMQSPHSTWSSCSKHQSVGAPWLMLAATRSRWVWLTACRWIDIVAPRVLSRPHAISPFYVVWLQEVAISSGPPDWCLLQADYVGCPGCMQMG